MARHRHVCHGLACCICSLANCCTFCSFEAVGLVAVTVAGLAAGKLVPLGGTEEAPGRLFCISRSFLMAALAAVAAWRGTLVLFNGTSGVPSAASSILKRVCKHMTIQVSQMYAATYGQMA